MYNNIAIVGAGAIGSALVGKLSVSYPSAVIHVFSSKNILSKSDVCCYHKIDYSDEKNISDVITAVSTQTTFDLVIVTTGVLHGDEFAPEKCLKDLCAENMQRLFYANTVIPSLLAKYFLPNMEQRKRAIFAVLSARVGSITDNRLGGWYSYRASKTALNMVVKNLSIELGRKSKNLIIVGLHPGTVDSFLSAPFSANIAKDKLFTPNFAADSLLMVMNKLQLSDSGALFAWNGEVIAP